MLARGHATTANRPERAFHTSTCVETRRRGYPNRAKLPGLAAQGLIERLDPRQIERVHRSIWR